MSYLGVYLIVCFLGFLLLPKDLKIQRYCRNVMVSLDQLVNSWVLFGVPDETISSRAHKGMLKGNKGWTLLAKILNKIDPGHTEKSVEWDEGTIRTGVPLKVHTTTKEDK